MSKVNSLKYSSNIDAGADGVLGAGAAGVDGFSRSFDDTVEFITVVVA